MHGSDNRDSDRLTGRCLPVGGHIRLFRDAGSIEAAEERANSVRLFWGATDRQFRHGRVLEPPDIQNNLPFIIPLNHVWKKEIPLPLWMASVNWVCGLNP